MKTDDAAVAIFANHHAAEVAVKQLAVAGFDMKNLSVVGKGYHTEEKVVGFYNFGDRVTFWGKRGAFWGGLWGLFFGGLFLTIPIVGHVIVLGYLAATIIANAIDLPDHPAVIRCPADELQPDSDLGSRLVTREVGFLTDVEIASALEGGCDKARQLLDLGLIEAAALHLKGEIRVIGLPSPAGDVFHRPQVNESMIHA